MVGQAHTGRAGAGGPRRGARACPPDEGGPGAPDVLGDPDWIFERKLDGIRCLAIRSRRGRRGCCPATTWISPAAIRRCGRPSARQPSIRFAVDGEVVAFDGAQTSFARLAERGRRPVPVFLYVFDLLWLDGYDVRDLALRTRKRLLQPALTFDGSAAADHPPQSRRRGDVRGGLPQGLGGRHRQAGGQPVPGDALARLAEVQVRGRPGARHRRLHRAPGQPRPTSARCWSATTTKARLRYAGKVGTGFDHDTLQSLGSRLQRLRTDSPRSPTPARSASAASPGCGRTSSPSWASPSGRQPAGCATRASWGCARTSRRARWCGSGERNDQPGSPAGGDQPSGQGAVHRPAGDQARPRRVTTNGSPMRCCLTCADGRWRSRRSPTASTSRASS